MTKQTPKARIASSPETGAGAPDEILTLSRSALVEGMVAEILDFFDEPRLGGSSLPKSQARWIVAGGVRRAIAACLVPRRRP